MPKTKQFLGIILTALLLHACSSNVRSLFGASSASLAGDTSVAARTGNTQEYTGKKGLRNFGASSETQSAPAEDPMPRKVVRNVDLSLSVKDADALLYTVVRLAKESKGYVADQKIAHSDGVARSGTVILRVPADRLDDLYGSLHDLGQVTNESSTADDISDQYYDLAARLANARQFEQRLLKMLKEHTGSIADLVTVESKLAEIREQIERFEGKQRLWDNQVSLATITLNFSTTPPPVPPVVPKTLGEKLWATLTHSWEALVDFGEVALTAFVAVLPWLPLLFAGLWLMRWMLRRWMRLQAA